MAEAEPVLPQAVFIDSPAGPLFGWYHAAPDGGAGTGEGVVLCNPLAYEAVCAHRAYRELAERLAAAGYPSLRFDYHGTGDSGGSDGDPRRVEAMLESVKAAAVALRTFSGVGGICLFGVRMGATLAMQAAAEMGGVKSLIAWAPFAKGKSYVREMKAFRRMAEKEGAPAPGSPSRADGDEEAGGFLMTKETLEALSRLDVTGLNSSPARTVLLIPREGAEEDPALVAALERGGAAVAVKAAAGYDAMMIHPHASVVPDAAFGAIERWLSERARSEERKPLAPAAAPAVPLLRVRLGGAEVEERPVRFGESASLFGIVSENAEKGRRSRVAVVFLNAGHVSRIGPSRFYTRFARQWAALGVTCFRVDLTGLGDSPGEGTPDELMFSETTVQDVEAAMAFLRSTRGLERFILVGLCSGAYTAFHAGLRAESVAGEILVNPPIFYLRAGDYSVNNYNEARHYARALFRASSLKRALTGQVDFARVFAVLVERARNAGKEAAAAAAALLRGRSGPPQDLAQALGEMSRKGIGALLVFSPGEEGLRCVEESLERAPGLAAGPGLRMEIVDGADHTFSALWSQDRLCALLTDHVVRLASGG